MNMQDSWEGEPGNETAKTLVREALLCAHVLSLSRVQPFATLWTVAHQDPLSMGFSRQQCWSGVPLPSPHRVAMKVKLNDIGKTLNSKQ